jgi:hypothetical protein
MRRQVELKKNNSQVSVKPTSVTVENRNDVKGGPVSEGNLELGRNGMKEISVDEARSHQRQTLFMLATSSN